MDAISGPGLDYDLVPLLLGALLAVLTEWLLRFREVSVTIAIMVAAMVSWSLFAANAPGLVGLLEMLVDHVEAATTSGFLIGLTLGNHGAALLRSLQRNLFARSGGQRGRRRTRKRPLTATPEKGG